MWPFETCMYQMLFHWKGQCKEMGDFKGILQLKHLFSDFYYYIFLGRMGFLPAVPQVATEAPPYWLALLGNTTWS